MNQFARQLLENYNDLMDCLIEEGLLIDSNPLEVQEYEVLEDSGEKIRKTNLTWSGMSGLSYLMEEHASIEQYTEIVKRRDFNFCLYDGSLIQIHYQVSNDGIIKHRLCYVPCPFFYPTEEHIGLGLCDIPDLMNESDFRREIRLCSPIRFDFDAKFFDDKHSHSHVTLNRSTCRLPAYGPVSLGHFIRFIFRYFYEEKFEASSWWHDYSPRIYTKTLASPFPHEFHLQSSTDTT